MLMRATGADDDDEPPADAEFSRADFWEKSVDTRQWSSASWQ
jgi:hypothetical protein